MGTKERKQLLTASAKASLESFNKPYRGPQTRKIDKAQGHVSTQDFVLTQERNDKGDAVLIKLIHVSGWCTTYLDPVSGRD